jgi:signal transduction histidine kinase
VVLFLDDLQWAGSAPVGFVDLVLSEKQIDGLLLVAAYREDEAGAARPLAMPLSRWRQQDGVRNLRLVNLPAPSVAIMVAEMLHVDLPAASDLVEAISPRAQGNPYETVELLNLLRRDGVLTATAAGWRWDMEAVRARLGQSEVSRLLTARVDSMPPESRQVLETMACLGGRTEVSVLQTATAESSGALEQALAPALDEGLLVVEPGAQEGVRFRHDRVREVILHGLPQPRRRALRLAMARRLAAVPELFTVAAEQYLPAADAVHDPAERRVVTGLLRHAAEQAAFIGDYALVNALLTGALQLIGPAETGTLVEVHAGRHAALYSMGRLEEADQEYRIIEELSGTAAARTSATAVQMRSLTHRKCFTDAIALGLEALRELGIDVPVAGRLRMELDRQFTYLYQWLDHTDSADDLARPDITDPRLLAASHVLNAILPAAYFAADHAAVAWLSLEAMRIWLKHGPSRALIGPASHTVIAAVALRGDYRAAYQTMRRIVALGEARGHEPETSQARFIFGHISCWFEPLENGVQAVRQAREGLIAGGDLANAGYTYHPTGALLDCAPTLDAHVTEAEEGLAFVRRTGSEQTGQWLDSYLWLAAVLRGEASAAAEQAIPVDRYADNPLALLHAHISRAIAAAISGDLAGLTRHAAAAMPLVEAANGVYAFAMVTVLHGLALAGQARASRDDERGESLSALDDVTRWLAARAADAPDNFLHLLRLLEAERAWAAGDFRGGCLAFDAARREVAQRQRPWHRALIAERAGRFYLAHGVEYTGYELLGQARDEYLAWGATAKAGQLDWAYPALRPAHEAPAGHAAGEQAGRAPRRSVVATGTIDLLGILSASQALSSETSIHGLHSRVSQVLSAITGATGVHLLQWDDDRQDWLLPAPGGGVLRVSGGGREYPVPLSVLRYVQRTREPVVSDDATHDDRFIRDPYFAGVTCCSLLAVPIISRGLLHAVLVLENRLIGGAFSTERLEGVKLIAGQLAVSLDNAQLYAEFRRIADEQAALRRVATLVARGAGPGLVFTAVAEEVAQVVAAADVTWVGRYDTEGAIEFVGGWSRQGKPGFVGSRVSLGGHNVSTLVAETGQPARVDRLERESTPMTALAREWARSSAGAPIKVEGRLWGLVTAASLQPNGLPAGIEHKLADFTDLVATAISNTEAQAQLTASRARIVASADEARRRIERDLHDGAQQRLVALALQLRAARTEAQAGQGELAARLDQVAAGLDGALGELRDLARGIHPAVLAQGGLGLALKALVRRSSVPVRLDVRVGARLPEHIEVGAYYVVSEALTNVVKHAHATQVAVRVEVHDDMLHVSVHDDGRGGAGLAGGSGLVGLKDRVEALRGRLSLDSPPGAGTALRAELPLSGPIGTAEDTGQPEAAP